MSAAMILSLSMMCAGAGCASDARTDTSHGAPADHVSQGAATVRDPLGKARPDPVLVRITPDELVETPVGPLIYGNFIECGIGRQVEGLWAQLFFNRGFETVPPYTPTHWEALGRPGPVDITQEPWFHSGYEEPPWYLVPGNPDAEWSYSPFVSFHNGRQGAWLKNNSPDKWAAFAQDGIYLRQGERYEFSGWLRTGTWHWDLGLGDLTVNAELRLYREGDWSKPILTHTIRGIGKAFQRYSCTFDNQDFQGRTHFSVWIPPRSGLGVDDFSLMPASNLHGWRQDVIEAGRRVHPTMIRWPGGCFASFYHWRDGIGPRADRVPTPSWFWGGLYDNDVGTPEFVQLCRLLGTEPLICVNLLTGSPAEAAEWVAYCNAPPTHPMGALRRADGFEEPFGVKYWELDNEAYRRFGPYEYAERCVEFARAMRAVDPAIKLAMIGYDTCSGPLAELLDIAGQHVDFVIDRAVDEPSLRRDLEIIRACNGKRGTQIRLCNTDWPAPLTELPPDARAQLPARHDTAVNRRRHWDSALNTASTLLLFQRLGGDFAFANFNNFANTWGQNVIDCPKEGACVAAAGRVLELFSRSPAARPLKLDTAGLPESVAVQAAWDEARRVLCLVVLNRTDREVPLAFDWSALGKRFKTSETATLRAPSLLSCNTPAKPDTVERTDSTGPLGDAPRRAVAAPPYSVTHVVLR
jgi:alpha-N-arabinofuranosidase